MLLAEQKKSKTFSEGVVISDKELIDEIKTFIIAGTESTSNFIVGMIFLIFEHPKVVEKLRE